MQIKTIKMTIQPHPTKINSFWYQIKNKIRANRSFQVSGEKRLILKYSVIWILASRQDLPARETENDFRTNIC